MERLRQPVANLIRVAKATCADFVFELGNLVGGEVAWITLVVEGAEGVQALVAEDTEPVAQLGETDPQQVGDFCSGVARQQQPGRR